MIPAAAAPTRPFAEIFDVAMLYGGPDGTLARETLNVRVAERELVSVVGPSGCGKSTLMRLMSGPWLPTDGSVIIDGKAVDRPLSIVGMAFQNPTLPPWGTILENVMLPLEVVAEYRTRMRKEKANCLARARELPRLAGFEARLPHQLSRSARRTESPGRSAGRDRAQCRFRPPRQVPGFSCVTGLPTFSFAGLTGTSPRSFVPAATSHLLSEPMLSAWR